MDTQIVLVDSKGKRFCLIHGELPNESQVTEEPL